MGKKRKVNNEKPFQLSTSVLSRLSLIYALLFNTTRQILMRSASLSVIFGLVHSEFFVAYKLYWPELGQTSAIGENN